MEWGKNRTHLARPDLISGFLILWAWWEKRIFLVRTTPFSAKQSTTRHLKIHITTKAYTAQQLKVYVNSEASRFSIKKKNEKETKGYILSAVIDMHDYQLLCSPQSGHGLLSEGLARGCALHMKQDIAPYSLREFTSSTSPLLQQAGPFSWRPDIPGCTRTFLGPGS